LPDSRRASGFDMGCGVSNLYQQVACPTRWQVVGSVCAPNWRTTGFRGDAWRVQGRPVRPRLAACHLLITCFDYG